MSGLDFAGAFFSTDYVSAEVDFEQAGITILVLDSLAALCFLLPCGGGDSARGRFAVDAWLKKIKKCGVRRQAAMSYLPCQDDLALTPPSGQLHLDLG
jgi:hypothetical protein